MQLPSLVAWTEEIADQLLDGERLSVTAPPGSGKSALVDSIAALLGESVVVARGREFDETNQLAKRQEILPKLEERVQRYGCAQLVFDDYHLALRRSQGGRLQSNLTAWLIDGAISRDVGALVLSRCVGPRHLEIQGSPLMSRFTHCALPKITQADVEAAAIELDTADEWFGDSALSLQRSMRSGRFAPMAVVAQARAGLDQLVEEFTPRVTSIVTGDDPLDSSLLLPEEEAALSGLLTQGGGLTRYATESGIRQALEGRRVGWPSALDDSVRAFLRLMDGSRDLLWVDRYVYDDLEALRTFLAKVSNQTQATITVVGAKRFAGKMIDSTSTAELSKIPNVKPKWMRRQDWNLLHDRHLARLDGVGGWVLPMASVVLCKQPPGSAVATPASIFGIDYRDVRRRSADARP